METITLQTIINAPAARVFDLARSLEMHQEAVKDVKEQLVDGRKNGLLNPKQRMKCEGIYFGMKQKLTAIVTKMKSPQFFEDQLSIGPFNNIVHEHYFEEKDGKTIMKDVFRLKATLGKLGVGFNHQYVQTELKKWIVKRNQSIKEYAENEEKWMSVLNIF